MKSAIMVVAGLTLCLVAASAAMAAQETSSAAIEKHLWELENQYVANHRDAAVDKIGRMWHEAFLGWPDTSGHPINKKQVLEYTRRRFSRPGVWNLTIKPEGIHVAGEMAVVRYLLTYFWKANGVKHKRVTRIVHAWVKDGSRWKILGGMGNNQEPKQ